MTEARNKEYPVSWEELHRNARALAWRLAELQPLDGVVAITRGGLVPAAIVARELDVRLIDTVCVASYDHKKQGAASILKNAGQAGDGEGRLIVDDPVSYPHLTLPTIYAVSVSVVSRAIKKKHGTSSRRDIHDHRVRRTA